MKREPPPPSPVEHLWTRIKGTHSRRALLRFHPHGVVFQILSDGKMSYGRLYPSRAVAEAEATTMRKALEIDGWINPSVSA